MCFLKIYILYLYSFENHENNIAVNTVLAYTKLKLSLSRFVVNRRYSKQIQRVNCNIV